MPIGRFLYHSSPKQPRGVDTQAVMKTLHIKNFVFNTRVTCLKGIRRI